MYLALCVFALLLCAYRYGPRALLATLSPPTKIVPQKGVSVITGGASGIGKAVVEALLEKGDSVIACDINKEALEKLQQETPLAMQKNLMTVQADVSSAKSLENAAKVCENWLQATNRKLSAIVNCAGLIFGGPLVEMDDGEFEKVINVNIKGTFLATKKFFPLLRHRDGTGRVILISSEVAVAQMSAGFSAPYSMSKFAIEAYATGLRQELALVGVKVVVVNPGAMKTPLVLQQLESGSNTYFTNYAQKEGTLFAHALTVGAKIAESYMKRNMSNPRLVANAVCNAIHLQAPPTRIIVGMSMEMMLAGVTPQWILDAVTHQQLAS